MTLETQIAALGTMSTAELDAEFQRLFGRRPRYRSVPWLKKRIAHALQVATYGGLSRAARNVVDELAADVVMPTVKHNATDPAQGIDLRPGAVLQRTWHDQQMRVLVTADGFEWNGNRYGSLSAAAFAITGSKWNGRLFFNLVGRSSKR